MNNRGLSLILKEKTMILIGLIIGGLMFIGYYLLVYIPMYSTGTELFVRNIPQNDIISSYKGNAGSPSFQSESGFSNPLFNLTHILNSGNVSNRVYDSISKKYPEDLAKLGITSREVWNEKFSKLIKAKIEASTDIISISLKWPNPATADNVLDEIVKEFKITNLKIRKAVESKQRQYLDKQVSEIGIKLDGIRWLIKNYRLKYNAIDLENESTELTKARIDLQKQSEILKSDISYYNKKLSNLSSQLNFPNASLALRAISVGSDPYLVKLNQDLTLAKQNYSKLRAKFTDNYPDVISSRNEINTLINDIKSRQNESLQGAKIGRGIYDLSTQAVVVDMSRVQAEKASSISKLMALNSGVNKLLYRESLLPNKANGLEELQKQENALTEAYTLVKQAQLDAQIKENQVVDNIVVLKNYTNPSYLFSSILIKLIFFLSFGFFGALGVAWIKEEIEDKWFSSDEIEEVTGKRVLGTIPWFKSASNVSQELIHPRNSMMGMAYENITANIASKSYLDEAQVLSFISTINLENKSSISSNISATLARHKKSVVLVDTDFMNPAKLLKNINSNRIISTDLADIINEVNKHLRLHESIDNEHLGQIIKRALVPIDIEITNERKTGFYYLCVNKKTDNTYDYIATRGFKLIIDFLMKHNEFVLIDTPAKPFVFADISAVINMSDAVILISAMKTSKESLIKTIKKLDKSAVKTFGIITRGENSELEQYYARKAINMLEEEKV